MGKSEDKEKQAKKAFAVRMKAITLDRSLKPMSKCVAMSIYYEHMDGATGETKASQETIAKTVGATDRTLRSAYSELEANGHVVVEHHRGCNGTNKTRLLPATKEDVEKAKRRHKIGRDVPVEPTENRKIASGTPGARTGTDFPVEPERIFRQSYSSFLSRDKRDIISLNDLR